MTFCHEYVNLYLSTELNHKESVKVMNELRKKNFVSPIQNEQVDVQNEHLELNDYELDRAFRLAMVNMNNLAQSLANRIINKGIINA